MLVSLKLTPSELEALDKLVVDAGFKSRSDALREALGLLFHEFNLDGETRRRIRLERMCHTRRRRRRPDQE